MQNKSQKSFRALSSITGKKVDYVEIGQFRNQHTTTLLFPKIQKWIKKQAKKSVKIP